MGLIAHRLCAARANVLFIQGIKHTNARSHMAVDCVHLREVGEVPEPGEAAVLLIPQVQGVQSVQYRGDGQEG